MRRVGEDFGGELRRAAQMRRRFYGNFWGAPFTERMIEFARGHRGVKRVLGEFVAGDQGYVDLKKKLVRECAATGCAKLENSGTDTAALPVYGASRLIDHEPSDCLS